MTAITVQDLDNAQLDAITLAEVSNSRVGGVSTGLPINEATTRLGDVTKTVQGQLAELRFKVPTIDWTALTEVISNVQVYEFPVSSNEYYVAKVPVPFTTGASFTPSNWQLVILDTHLFGDTSPQLGSFLDPNENYVGSDKGTDIPSASPVVIGIDGDYFDVTGTIGFSSMTVDVNRSFTLQFDGVLTITHGAAISLPNDADYTTTAGDQLECFSVATDTVRIVSVTKADGTFIENIFEKGIDIPSASPLVIGTDGDYFDVTGTIGFSVMIVDANTLFILQFDGVLTIAHGAAINLPNDADFTTAAGDQLECFSIAPDTVRIVSVTKADGTSIKTELVTDLTPQLGGDLDGQDFDVSKVKLKDYGEIHNAIGSIGGGTQDIDLALGNSVSATVDTATTTFTISNPVNFPDNSDFNLILENGGSQSVIWPDTVIWPDAVIPILTISGTDILKFTTIDDGNIWHGNLVVKDSTDEFEGYNLDNISIVKAEVIVHYEDLLPTGMAFNNDGSKVFFVGADNDTIYEYNLITPYDLTTKSTVQASASVASEDTIPNGMAFNNNGTKVFIVGSSSNSFHEYNLTIPYNLTSISTVQASASIASEDISPRGMAFNNDGTKVFMIGNFTNRIFEYNLTTPFDLTTISPVQANAQIVSEDDSPRGMAFNNDGTKIYMVGIENAAVHEYTLSTPYDLNTISSVRASASVAFEDDFPQGIDFNNDGSKLYMIGQETDAMYEYNL